MPRAKEGRADTNLRRPFLDGELEIARHAHGQFRQFTMELARDGVAHLPQPPKDGPRLLRVGSQFRNRHQAAQFQPRHQKQPLHKPRELRGVAARLR
jgi:hypothetical protein